MANLTLAPVPWQTFFTDTGVIAAGHKLFTYAAGTTTKLATYSDVGGLVPQANPIVLDSAGRVPGGLFLLPVSYKMVLAPPADTDPPSAPIRTQDNIGATPNTTVEQDIAITAGVALTANDAAYISDGSGGLIAGRAYKADADFTYASTLPVVGFVVADIAAGATGTMRTGGRMTGFIGLTAGTAYFISATAGAITATAPANSRYVGQADSVTSLIITSNPRQADASAAAVLIVDPRIKTICNGRLTLTTNVPVLNADVTAATSVFWTPYKGNEIALYSGTAWQTFALAQLTIAVPATTATAYDLFIDWHATTPTLTLLAWTNLTTRATALTTQDGILVLTGALTRRYVGSFRTTGVSGQTELSKAKQYLWNYYNRVELELFIADATASWTYTVATIRQARATATNQVEVFVGVQEVDLDLTVFASGANTSGVSFAGGIGEDSTTTFAAGSAGAKSGTDIGSYSARLVKKPAIGHHVYSWNEWSAAVGTTTFYGSQGDSTPAGVANGLRGKIFG